MSTRPGGRSQRAEHHEEEEHENAERWLLSYADMITLLMALFIVLFAISQVDQKKLLQLSAGLEQYFGEPAAVTSSTGILDGSPRSTPDGQVGAPDPQASPDPIVPSRPGAAPSPTDLNVAAPQSAAQRRLARQREDMQGVRDRIAKSLAAKHLTGAVEFQMRGGGLVVNIVTDRVLFDVGEAKLVHEGRRVLAAISPTLRRVPNTLTIEGHTDNVPISGRFPSNWELSTARATTVLHYLLDEGVAGSRVSAAGYADQKPLTSNATAAGRSRNRRVAIVVHPLGGSDVLASAVPASSGTPGD